MKQTLLLLVLPGVFLAAALPAPARDKQENWIQVRSRHFVVATNANETQGRRVADQFERMRAVFHLRFPKLEIDPASPVIVLAIKDEKDFRALEPEEYLAKGQLKLGGLFLRAPDKNYVLMRLEAEGDHPYKVVYHEYTHLVLGKTAEWLPLWLNEGLAEFYQNTDIREKDVLVGEPSGESLAILRQQRLLPLTTLFKVDHQSPYYHEENKGSIFYAESWALTHYILFKDNQEKAHRLNDYVDSLSQNVDPVDAATRTFGDLKQLERSLEDYVHQASFYAFRMVATTEVDDSEFKVDTLSPAQTDALRADFLAYNRRSSDAQTLLDHVLQADPNNVSAHETKGFLEFNQGHLEEARKWYSQAVQLDSKSYLAHYYFAAMSMNAPGPPPDDQLESSLRAAIKLNPWFAPAFDLLAVFLGTHGKNLDEAHMMGLTAVALEPGNVGYRVNVANVLLRMEQGKNAVAVLRAAAKLAKTPEESQTVDNFLMNAQELADAQERGLAPHRMAEDSSAGATDPVGEGPDDSDAPKLAHDTFVAKGPHHFLVGMLKSVRCRSQQMDLTVSAGAKSLDLHSENYYKIRFTTLNFAPSGDLNPCKDLEGRPAKVEYVESANQSAGPRVLAIELHR